MALSSSVVFPIVPAVRRAASSFWGGLATELAVAGEPVLLGAGFARFGTCRNREGRGDQFESPVRSFGEPAAHRVPTPQFSPFSHSPLNPFLL
jgi:hypothetical protein